MSTDQGNPQSASGSPAADGGTAHLYEIRVQGRLAPHWSAWFGGLTVRPDAGTTVIRGAIVDQAALHGLLRQLRDVGLPLLSLTQIPTTTPELTAHPNHEEH